MNSHLFLTALTLVLGVAGITTVAFKKLKLPVVMGYILAGLIIGPHVPIPLVADPQVVQTLSESGVILVMFALGLEFSFGRLLKVGPAAGITAVIECSLMLWLGFLAGKLMGWTAMECLFTGAIVAISSTTIISKAFGRISTDSKLKERVVGILVIEDLIAILIMAGLMAVSTSGGLSGRGLGVALLRLVSFLVALVVVGRFVVPPAARFVIRLNEPEITLVASVGFCFCVAFVVREFGYSVALGAFVAGAFIAESGEERAVLWLIEPVRDMFAAIFFVSVGMLIDPAQIASHAWAVLILTLVVVVGKVLGVGLGSLFAGRSITASVRTGMSMAQIGEFSFILAGLGFTLGKTGSFLYPVAVAVSAATCLSTPLLFKASGSVANWIDRKLPRPIQTLVTLYGSWMDEARTQRQANAAVRVPVGKLARRLFLDLAILIAVIIGSSHWMGIISGMLGGSGKMGPELARLLTLAGAAAVSVPFAFGIYRGARQIGFAMAENIFPPAGEGSLDLGAPARRAFVVSLQIVVVLLAGIPLLAVTQPFISGPDTAIILVLFLVVLGISFWKNAANLYGHVQAGSQMILEALSKLAGAADGDVNGDEMLAKIREQLPGIGVLGAVRLGQDTPAAGKSLRQLNFRGVTGATVLAIVRGSQGVVAPTAGEKLEKGDLLAVTGTHEAVAAVRRLLAPPAAAGDQPA